jgi:heme-degrading monooxygenase HmoA
VREDGVVDAPGGAIEISWFEVPDGGESAFLAAWQDARDEVAGRQGYLGSRLLRAKSRWVSLARWSSPLMVQRARQGADGRPALYQAI